MSIYGMYVHSRYFSQRERSIYLACNPPSPPPSVKPTRLDQLAAHFLQWLLPQLFGCCKWGVKHRNTIKVIKQIGSNWTKSDQLMASTATAVKNGNSYWLSTSLWAAESAWQPRCPPRLHLPLRRLNLNGWEAQDADANFLICRSS